MKMLKNTLLALAVVLLSPLTANAVLIEIAGDDGGSERWEVTFVEGSYEDFADELAMQAWWGDSALAMAFANAVGLMGEGPDNQLGLGLGAFFLRGDNGAFTAFHDGSIFGSSGARGFLCTSCVGSGGRVFIFALAERVSVPEPGTLALLGLGLVGMGFSRRRKV